MIGTITLRFVAFDDCTALSKRGPSGGKMNSDFASNFVRTWESAWNARDLDAVLSHFHEEATFASPIASRLFPESGGIVRGRELIRLYWAKALALIPDLHFTVERYFVGIDILVIQYRNQRGAVVDEILMFENNLVRHGFGTYTGFEQNPAGLT
jgi:ketosteroid isomerase-like protein